MLNYIRNQEEYTKLAKMTEKITEKNATLLQHASKLSEFCKQTIKFPKEMPPNRAWYEASAYESLAKWKVGNCLNYAKALIGLAHVKGIEGRIIWIHGKVQGHALCELEINGKWTLFDALYGVPFLDKPNPKTPNAYDCWKDPTLYINAINPKYYGHSDEFWKEIWSNFHIQDNRSIQEVGEWIFLKMWYPKASYPSNIKIAENWWYTTFREQILGATDDELPLLYEVLYQNYLYKDRDHTPFYEAKPISVNDDGVLFFSDISNDYKFVRFLMRDYIKDSSILELGCGISSFPFILVTDGGRVYAMDMRSGVVKHTRGFIKLLPDEAQKNIRFDCALAEKLPYENNFFDVIVGVDFIEHIRNLDRLMDEVVRVLKPNGRVCFATPIKGIRWSPEHLHNLDEEKIRTLFTSHGFEVKIHLERYSWRFLKPNSYIIEAKLKKGEKTDV